MLYFSDYGLMTKDRDSRVFATLTHGDTNPNKGAYIVPFAILNSDDTIHRRVKVQKSGFNFLNGFSNWLGIEEASLNFRYNFLSTEHDTLKV